MFFLSVAKIKYRHVRMCILFSSLSESSLISFYFPAGDSIKKTLSGLLVVKSIFKGKNNKIIPSGAWVSVSTS